MHHDLARRRNVLPQGGAASSREGRDCEGSRRLTTVVLFPRLDAMPGPWVLFLTGLCSLVAIRALELGLFLF